MTQTVTSLDPSVVLVRKPTLADRIRLARYACGHRDVRNFEFLVFGSEIEISETYRAKRTMCGDCETERMRKSAIRCCRCGAAILHGGAVCLYQTHDNMPPDTVLVRSRFGIRAIGCLGWNCADGGLCWGGNWTSEGVREPREVPSGGATLALEPDMQGELLPRVQLDSSTGVS